MKTYISGNEAVARAALECGATVITGYPGTPSSEAIGNIWKTKRPGVEIQWSTNEKVALEIASAASWAGKASLCTMKMSGLNVAYDSLISVVYSGCTGAMVLYVCDDPGVSAGMPEQDVRGFAKMSDMPVIEPASVEDSYRLTRYAFELSYAIQSPVMLRSVTNVALSHAIIDVDDDPKPIGAFSGEPKFTLDIAKYTKAGAKICMDQHRDLIARLKAAEMHIHEDNINTLTLGNNGGLGIVAVGVSVTYITEALNMASIDTNDVSVLNVKTSIPAPVSEMSSLLEHCGRILVVEENEPYVEDALILEAYKLQKQIPIHGKCDSTLSRISNFDAGIVANAIKKVMGISTCQCSTSSDPTSMCAARPIGVCAGCPHRGVFIGINRGVKKAGYKKDEVIVTGDIGCTILGMSPPFNTLWTEVAMGASISMAQGFKYAGFKAPVIATIGDSTFLHGGIPGLINAIQNNVDVTLIIMDNGWTAMTGMQVNAGTAPDFQQTADKHIVDIKRIVEALEPDMLTVVDPYDLDDMTKAVQTSITAQGVKVILARRECAIQAGRRGIKYGKRVVNNEKCTRCKLCILTTGCPALIYDGNNVLIDQSQCNGCGICVSVCPVNAIQSN